MEEGIENIDERIRESAFTRRRWSRMFLWGKALPCAVLIRRWSGSLQRGRVLPALLLGAVMLLAPACQEKIDWELEMENALRLVVTGKITNEPKAHEVHLSLPVFEINGSARPVQDAEVAIFYDDTSHMLTRDSERPGVYLTAPDFRGVVNKTYMLGIRVNDVEFAAIARMEGVTPIRYPGYYRVSEDPELYELFFRGDEAPSMMKVELDWSELPGYDTLPDSETHAVIYGYTFDPLTVDANEIFSAERDRVYVPPGAQMIITKESLSDGYAEYLRGMLSETTWNGGLFDVKPGDPFTNLSAGALGYFAATTVVRDTVVFEP